MSRAHLVTTRTGIVIGGAYIPKPRFDDEDHAALLQAKPLAVQQNSRTDWLTSVAAALAVVAMLVILSGCGSDRDAYLLANRERLLRSDIVKTEPDKHGVVCYRGPSSGEFSCVKVQP